MNEHWNTTVAADRDRRSSRNGLAPADTRAVSADIWKIQPPLGRARGEIERLARAIRAVHARSGSVEIAIATVAGVITIGSTESTTVRRVSATGSTERTIVRRVIATGSTESTTVRRVRATGSTESTIVRCVSASGSTEIARRSTVIARRSVKIASGQLEI